MHISHIYEYLNLFFVFFQLAAFLPVDLFMNAYML
jgi:hypothetical protein